MLELNGNKEENKEEIPSTATGTIREIIARHIAARNHGLSPRQFTGAVSALTSSLVAACLLEEAGIFRHGSVGEQVGVKGLAEGLSSLFQESSPGDQADVLSGLISTGDGPWPDLSACKSLSIDPKVPDRLVAITEGKIFRNEWADAWSESHERSMIAYLRNSARLYHDGRMAIEENYQGPAQHGLPLVPAGLLQRAAADLVLPGLAGKTPKNAGIRVIDPACRTGRVLLAMYRVITDWHLSWYRQHLVPLLEEGRDPASRKVQVLVPVVSYPDNRAGYMRFGTLPLPVYQLPDGQWDLTWDEKVRILGDSVYGIDSDPAAVEVTRLSLMSCLLENTGPPGKARAGLRLLRAILSGNIRYGSVLIGRDYEEQPTLLPGRTRHVPGIVIADEYPEVMSGGGFGVVFSMFPSELPFSGKDLQDYLCRHYRSGKPDDATPYYLESGLLMTRPGGLLCGIVSGGWQRSHNAAHFREWLAGYQVERVVSLGKLQSFSGIRDPVLITFVNRPPAHPVRVTSASGMAGVGEENSGFGPVYMIDQGSLGAGPWTFKGVPPAEIRKKIDSAGTPLARYTLGEYMLAEHDSTFMPVISRHEYSIILRKDPVIGSFIHPCIIPTDIRKYFSPGYSSYIVRIPPGTTRALAGDAPDLREWFYRYHHTIAAILKKSESMLQRGVTEHGCWWEWAGPAPPRFMDSPYLVTRASGLSGGPEWMIAPPGAYPGNGVLAVPCHDPALPGILNSDLAKFYILSSARKKGMAGYLARHLLRFPVVVPDTEETSDNLLVKKIAGLVEKRSVLVKAAGTEGNTGAFVKRVQRCDDEIDTLVYELYGLTRGEINSIGDWLSKEEGLRTPK
jgi:hypothetical protein